MVNKNLPQLFSKAAEWFVRELTIRAAQFAIENKRKTIKVQGLQDITVSL